MTFFFTFVFMFLVFWRPQEWLVPQLYGIPILNGIFFLALLCLVIEKDAGRLRIPKHLPHFSLLVGFYGAVMVSHIAHLYLAGLLNSIEAPLKLVAFTWLLIVVLDSPAKLRWVAWLLVLMAAVMSAHFLLQQARGYGFAGLRPLRIPSIAGRPPYLRSLFFGIFGDPNDAGQFVVSAMPFCFVLFRRRSLFALLVGWGLIWLLLLGLGSTYSRGAQVGLVALAAMLVVLRFPQRWMPVLVPLGLAGLLLVLPVAGRGLDMSARQRVVLWGFSNSHLIRNPVSLLFGLGFGMGWQIPSMYGMPGTRIRGLTFHNAFVHCYAEIGYFGFIFWFGLILAGILGCWLVRKHLVAFKKDPGELGFLWRYAGAAICSMMSFSASGYFLSRAFIFPLFFLMGVLGSISRVARDEYLKSESLTEAELPVGFLELPTNAWVFYPIVAGFGIVYVWLSCIMLNLGL